MNRFTTSTLDGYLRLIRRPVDGAVGLLPGRRTGPGAAARVTVDRVDATIRSLLGATLRDEALSEDADRRQQAAVERQRALKLRQDAEAVQARTEDRLQARHEQSSERREQARGTAASRRRQAERTEQSRTQRARQAESERLQASRAQEQGAEEQIERQESQARLPGVEEQAHALAEHEVALQQADEARRIGSAAARVKRERKEG
jgi:hypothetical protein